MLYYNIYFCQLDIWILDMMTEHNNMQFMSGEHDHKACISAAIACADKVCVKRNQRFTALRKRVFELVWRQHKPIRAYDVLEELQKDGRAAPPTVYRALDFLLNLGLIHRIESLNAYVGCTKPEREHQGHFLICTECLCYAELNSPEIKAAIISSAQKTGFEVQHHTIEIMGLCPKCKEKRDKV